MGKESDKALARFAFQPGDFVLGGSDNLPGGLADDRSPNDFDPEALAEGVKVEMEHTDDEAVAREIAMDHLAEDPAYYKKLAKVEAGKQFSVDDLPPMREVTDVEQRIAKLLKKNGGAR